MSFPNPKNPFIGAAVPWVRNAPENELEEIRRRYNRVNIDGNSIQRDLVVRPGTLNNVNRETIVAAAEPLFRWDYRTPEVIFRQGFWPLIWPPNLQAFRNLGEIPINLYSYINDWTNSTFVSTTRAVQENSAGAVPQIWAPQSYHGMFRYDLFVWGGVDVHLTYMRNLSQVHYPQENEIAFPFGVRSELIRSAVYYDGIGVARELWINARFNPLLNGPHTPPVYQLPQLPSNLRICFIDPGLPSLPDPPTRPGDELRAKAGVPGDDSSANNGNLSTYVLKPSPTAPRFEDPAFVRRSCLLLPNGQDVVFFADTRCVTVHLDTKRQLQDTMIDPPGVQNIAEAWPPLAKAQFPCVDATLQNPANKDEFYFFYREKYILINVKTRREVFGAKIIINEWPSLKKAGFDHVDAAVLMANGSAYFFKGTQYVQVKINPGTNNDTIVGGGPKPIDDNWSVLRACDFNIVDMILTSPNKPHQYFFSGNEYVRMIINQGNKNDKETQAKQHVAKGWSSLIFAKFYQSDLCT